MRNFIIFIAFIGNLFACSGECIACHPKLVKKDGKMDKEHQILNRCKNCHRDGTKIKMLDSNSSTPKFKIVEVKDINDTTHVECGSDCWQCHDIKAVSSINIAEHKILKTCIACHIKLDKNLLQINTTPSLDNTLERVIK